nr:hypothetical protein [Mycobacterium sp. Z3061]
MVELDTQQQALAYLAQIFPESNFRVVPFELGWVGSPILPQENPTGPAVGSTKLVIDSQTGVVTEYPSWSTNMVAEDYVEARRTGRPPTGGQIYPYQWRIAIRRLREDPEVITYQMTAVSLKDPPEPTREHPLTINKHTLLSEPPDTLSSVATSQAEWMSRQNQGVWPAETTTEF